VRRMDDEDMDRLDGEFTTWSSGQVGGEIDYYQATASTAGKQLVTDLTTDHGLLPFFRHQVVL